MLWRPHACVCAPATPSRCLQRKRTLEREKDKKKSKAAASAERRRRPRVNWSWGMACLRRHHTKEIPRILGPIPLPFPRLRLRPSSAAAPPPLGKTRLSSASSLVKSLNLGESQSGNFKESCTRIHERFFFPFFSASNETRDGKNRGKEDSIRRPRPGARRQLLFSLRCFCSASSRARHATSWERPLQPPPTPKPP